MLRTLHSFTGTLICCDAQLESQPDTLCIFKILPHLFSCNSLAQHGAQVPLELAHRSPMMQIVHLPPDSGGAWGSGHPLIFPQRLYPVGGFGGWKPVGRQYGFPTRVYMIRTCRALGSQGQAGNARHPHRRRGQRNAWACVPSHAIGSI